MEDHELVSHHLQVYKTNEGTKNETENDREDYDNPDYVEGKLIADSSIRSGEKNH